MSVTRERRSEILLSNIRDDDCGVIAIQAVTSLSRARAEQVALDVGWDADGITGGNIEFALSKLGYKTRLLRYDDLYGQTPATFALEHPSGTYLLYTDGHVSTVRDGDLFNCRGWNSALEAATEVVKP